MPRLIYETVGQVSLGLWDLGWSFLVYVSFSGIGFGPAIAYYSARHRANDEDALLAETNTTGVWCQLAFAIALGVLFVSGFALVSSLTDLLGPQESRALSEIGIFLGMAITLVIAGDAAHGALIGRHKARITEYINMVHDIGLAVAMVCVLLLDYGIVGLAIATFLLRLIIEMARFWFALRLCDEFGFKLRLYSFGAARKLTRYAIKTSTAVFQELLIFQTARLALFIGAGPVALAAFSRYATIARQINRLTERLSISLPAVASSFNAQGDHEEIKNLYVNSARVGMLLTLPILSIFCVFGDAIVELWMGPEFVAKNISWIFAAGALLHAHYAICTRVMSGINAHGRITLACLSLSGFTFLVICFVTFPQDMFEAALIITCVMLLTVHLPYIIFTGWKLSISAADVIADIYIRPLLLNACFLATLYIANVLRHAEFPITGNVLILTSVIILGVCYWFLGIGERLKVELTRALKLKINPTEVSS